MTKLKKDQWFIIRKTLVKDKWAFFTIYTKSSWKQSFFVHNIKKSKNIPAAHLSLWSVIDFNYSAKKEFNSISETKLIFDMCNLNYDALKLLSYVLDLVNVMTVENNKNDEFYDLINKALHYIKSWKSLARICLFFEINLLTILWYIWSLNTYNDTHDKIDLTSDNYFDKEIWWIIKNKLSKISNELFQISQNQIKIIYFFQTWKIQDIMTLSLPFCEFKEILYLFRAIILKNCPFKLKLLPCFSDENVIE